MARRNPLVTLLIVAGVISVLGLLFVSTLRDVASEPYRVDQDQLTGWRVASQVARDAYTPIVLLQPPATLPMSLFDQVFQRTMSSYTTPMEPGIPLVLKGEYDAALAGVIRLEEIVALARDLGLEDAVLQPGCVIVDREPGPRERVSYLVRFDLPGFREFRDALAGRLVAAGSSAAFDPAGLSPELLVAVSDRDVYRYLSRRDTSTECAAPLEVE